MLDNFLSDLEELLHSTPFSSVDILPLVIQYTEGKDDNEIVKIRLRIIGILDQLKESKLIEIGKNYNFLLSYMPEGRFLGDPIYVRSTIKFENNYNEKRKQTVLPITNIITHGDNSPIAGHNLAMGDIVQSSSKNNQNTLSKIVSWMFKNIIIVILVSLISAYLIWKFGWN